MVVHRQRGDGGEGVILSQQTGCMLRGGRGGSVSIRSQGRAASRGEGGGGVCADTRLPIDEGQGQISAAPLCSKLMPEVFKMSRKLLRSSKVLEERMLGDTGCKILG